MATRYLTLGKRNQITLPHDLVKEGASFYECEARGDGSILLTPQVPVPAAQAYFWSRRWQEGEKQASKDIRSKRLRRYDNAKSLVAVLEKRRKR